MDNITIIDYGLGNILSVERGFEYFGVKVVLTSDKEEIRNASKLVLPGVGAFSVAMAELNSLGFTSVIKEVAKKGTPILGICLGMQMLLDESEEFGLEKGLGLIPGRVVSIPNHRADGVEQKIPHIGWNEIVVSDGCENWESKILKGIKQKDSFYFLHSYMALPENNKNCIADCFYGGVKISSVINNENIYGCQFHPEKSGEAGLAILKNFIQL